jgi:2-oxoglutarate ferredoxin oxidoreductase subunit alpha
MDYSIKIGGEAGQGLQTIGDVLAQVFSKAGYHVFSHQDYESRIRGGHNFYQIRVADSPVMSSRERIDVIVALDHASIKLHKNELTKQGILIYDSETLKENIDDPAFLDIPFKRLAIEEGGNPITANTVATGAVIGMLNMDLSILNDLIKETFKKKGDAVVEGNIKAAKAGYEYSKNKCLKCSFSLEQSSKKPKILINGIEAIVLGALASGCKFYSAYPMTPSTGIMNSLASKAEEFGIVVEQAEDEIAAINMALGASFSGVRAMTGTSGGGFALMVEGLSLAGMTETPIVIAEGQRPGPATGLPTRTEQGDLLFVIHTAHGEFPRVVFAPGTPQQALYLTNKAFDLAEKYQIPALIVFDQYLADSQWTFENFNSDKLVYKDYRLRGKNFKALKEYKRHAFTPTGVTPLAVPGDSEHVVVTDSDEHDEEGHIIEDAPRRIKMTDKRLFKKLQNLKKEISQPTLYGSNKPEIILTGWGSTYGVIKETVDELNRQGKNASMLHFSEIYPFPESGNYLQLLNNAGMTVCIENNATRQLAKLMRAETGFKFKQRINRFDGRPFTVDYILRGLNVRS